MDFLVLSHDHLAKHFTFYHDPSLDLVGRWFPVETNRWIIEGSDLPDQLDLGLNQHANQQILLTSHFLDFLNEARAGNAVTCSWADILKPDDPVIFGTVDQEHGCEGNCPATGICIIERPVGFGDVAINIAQEHEWKIEPLPKLFVNLGGVVGGCHELHSKATNLPVGLTQLRQVQSSGGSPVSTIEVQHNRAAPGEPA